MIPLMKNAFLEEKKTREELAQFLLGDYQLSMGNHCFEFEKAFAHRQGRLHAILFNSGASANLALLQAYQNLGRISRGSSIGFSAVTWATNVMPILQLGMLPVPIDCSTKTLNMMSDHLKDRLKTTSLQALFLTNALGFSGDLVEIRDICQENGILLLEDNCESLGTVVSGEKTGNFGEAATFSFYVAHHMSTIEGGMVCTDDENLAIMLKLVRANGWDRNLTLEQKIEFRSKNAVKTDLDASYTFYDLGFNLRPTEITGVLGNIQLRYLDSAIEKRRSNYSRLSAVARGNPDFYQIETGHLDVISNFAFPIICKSKEIRDSYVDCFMASHIEVRPIIAGNIQNQPFYKKYVSQRFSLPEADFLQANAFYCGNCPDYTEEDLDVLCSVLEKKENKGEV